MSEVRCYVGARSGLLSIPCISHFAGEVACYCLPEYSDVEWCRADNLCSRDVSPPCGSETWLHIDAVHCTAYMDEHEVALTTTACGPLPCCQSGCLKRSWSDSRICAYLSSAKMKLVMGGYKGAEE